MGGRGAKSGGGGAGGGAGGGLGAATPILGAVPPPIQPGMPAPAITTAQLQAMNADQFTDYLNALRSTPIDQNIYYNNSWDTQRLIANMPDLNQAPQMVDAKTFAGLPGNSLYRTVNETTVPGNNSNWSKQSAIDICARTMTSDVTTIGAGALGDGFYFSPSKSVSQSGYGHHRGDVNKTATMEIKLNNNARVVSYSDLTNMFNRESSKVQNAVLRAGSSSGGWRNSGFTAYALWKGYNVVDDGGRVNIIDRRAATWSSHVEAWK